MMPLYDFQCETCGHVIEDFFKMADKPQIHPAPCPKCHCGELISIISSPMVLCDEGVNTPWLRDFAHAHNRFGGKRARDGGKAIESRTDYKNYLERNDLRPDAPSISTSHD